MADRRKTGSTWRDRFSRKGQKGQAGSAAQTSSEPTATQPADVAEWKDSNDASGAQESSGSVQVSLPGHLNHILIHKIYVWLLEIVSEPLLYMLCPVLPLGHHGSGQPDRIGTSSISDS